MYSEVVLAGTGAQVATNANGQAVALLNYLREVEASVGYQ
jgi:hypothetical protein